MDEDDTAEREAVALVVWVMTQLVRGGFESDYAGRLAARQVDYRKAVDMLQHGCSQKLVERILS